jgi:cyclic peptide transporter
MNIFQVLQKKSKLFYVFLILLGAVNSLLYSAILVFVNNTITQTPLPYFPQFDWALFIGLLVLSLIITRVFQTYMVKLTNGIVFDFELNLIQKIRFATYEGFDKIGIGRVYTAMNDTKALGQIPASFVNGINYAVVISCGLVYLFWISPVGSGAVLLLMVGLLIFYLVRNKSIEKSLNELRDLQNEYHQNLRDLLHGFKEIKMSQVRNENMFHKYLKRNLVTGRDLGIGTAVKYLDNELTGSYSWYIVLGLILFGLPRLFDLEMAQTTTFVVTILYLMGPVYGLIQLVPFYTRVKIAIERLQGFEADINNQVKSEIGHGDMTPFNQVFCHLELKDVTFEYFDKKKQTSFQLGPINLEIKRGEMVFITGGNGSGKSTLVNLLTGLCQPTSGHVYLNGNPITENNSAYYRNQISAIFTNNHVFAENYDDFDLSTANDTLMQYVSMMQLSQVLKIDDDKKNIDNRLSKGQHKRLAMIYALLEGRQLVVLDEWAAEQDPEFRAYFYKTILPELKNLGKTVIAVTHDDAYYGCANRIIKLDYGQVLTDSPVLTELVAEPEELN